MDELSQRLIQSARAVAALHELAFIGAPTAIERDAAIQRFEFTFEIMWKTAKEYLKAMEGIDARTPKSVIRYCRDAQLLTDEETVAALKMANDRNMTSHTYDERIAADIFSRLPAHCRLLEHWLAAMKAEPRQGGG